MFADRRIHILVELGNLTVQISFGGATVVGGNNVPVDVTSVVSVETFSAVVGVSVVMVVSFLSLDTAITTADDKAITPVPQT